MKLFVRVAAIFDPQVLVFEEICRKSFFKHYILQHKIFLLIEFSNRNRNYTLNNNAYYFSCSSLIFCLSLSGVCYAAKATSSGDLATIVATTPKV